MVLTNHCEDDVIYPLPVMENAQAQKDVVVLKKLNKHDKYSTQLVEDTHVLCKGGKMVIHTVSWHHHYLQHPEHTHIEETLHKVMY